MKLVIQIPCYNEAGAAFRTTLQSLPKELRGISSIEILVVDDGSQDLTSQEAQAFGAHHVLRLKSHQGLARAFLAGLRKAISLEAQIIVNLDADNQYPAHYLQALIDPILEGRADIVLGARDFETMKEISWLRRFFQRFGSAVVSRLCRAKIPDAATGFRAFSRDAARKVNVFTTYTYTLETLIQASHNKEKILSVPIRTNAPTRPSRLFSHPLIYVLHSAGALIRLTLLYNPLRVLSWTALFFASTSTFLFFTRPATCHGAGIFLLIAMMSLFTGLVLDQIAINRRLLDEVRIRDL